MSATEAIKGRYEKRQILGEGGMGVVYRAYDRDLKREVALKTLRDGGDAMALEMFRKECGVLASLNHPNIVDIYDVGQFEEDGASKPYFVMPLLPGTTLDRLIKDEPHRLTVERTVEIISQTCRGLAAAHDRGLIHRDLKPSNIFVLQDDSVKIIDFGIAYLAGAQTSVGLKGTVFYMAPEQLEMKPASAQSDIFALGVVCFETLTRRRPFTGNTRDEVIKQVLRTSPPAVSEINPVVSHALSQVIHAALAKKPYNRYQNAREFAECLQKALRGQAIERFNSDKIQPRLGKIEKALEGGEHDFANEVLSELEEEGYLHPALRQFRKRLDQTLRDRTTGQLLDSARRRFQEQEYQLALQKVQEVLTIDPQNATAQRMRSEIEQRRSADQVDGWLKLTRQHLDNRKFGPAREALNSVLQVRPNDPAALRLKAEIDRAEAGFVQARSQKQSLYDDAVASWQGGDITAALSKIEKVLELDRTSPEISPETSSAFQALYNKVRSEHDATKAAYDEARKHLAGGNFAAAGALCDEYLAKYPDHALFHSLRFDVGEAQRQSLSADMARVDRAVEDEPDLDRRVNLLETAAARHPGEHHFERALRVAVSKRDLVNSIVGKARNHEDRGQFTEALGQWDILRNIYPQYPGLDFEIERTQKRREQHARSNAKARWVEQVDQAMSSGDYGRAADLVRSAGAEFPGDAELAALETLARQGRDRAAEAEQMLGQARELRQQGKLDDAIGLLQQAQALDLHNPAVRAALVEVLVAQATGLAERNLDQAESALGQALSLDAGHTQGRNLKSMLADRRREVAVTHQLARARELQAVGNLKGAYDEVQRGLTSFPLEPRLTQLKQTLGRAIEETTRSTPVPKAPPPAAAEQATTTDHETLERIVQQARRGSVVPPPPAPAPPAGVTPPRPQPQAGRPVPPPPSPQAPAKTGAAPPVPPPPAAPGKKPPLWIAAVAVPVLGLIGWLALRPGGKKIEQQQAGPSEAQVQLQITPESARVKIGDRDLGTGRSVALAEGSYDMEVSAEGFESQRIPVKVAIGMGPVGPIALVPAAPVLIASLGGATATIDGGPLPAQNGQVTHALAPGEHTLQIWNGQTRATVVLGVAPGALPEVKRLGRVNLLVTVVSTFGAQGRVHGPVKAGLNGDLKDVPAQGGLELNGLGAQRQPLRVAEGEETHDYDVGSTAAPTIALYVADPGRVDLTITSNEEAAAVFIAGKQAGAIRNGHFMTTLPPGAYKVRVSKQGFLDVAEANVVLAKGRKAVQDFQLRPAQAVLRIVGATARAQLVVDDKPVGEVHPGEPFNASVDPGRRRIALRADSFQSNAQEVNFRTGEPVTLSWRELMTPLGKVQLTVTVPNMAVSYASGNGRPNAATPGVLTLPEGEYVFRGTVPGGAEQQKAVSVKLGQTTTVEFRAAAGAAAAAAKPAETKGDAKAATQVAQLESPPWKLDDDREWMGLSGGMAWTLRGAPSGTLSFDVRRRSRARTLFGGGKPTWMLVFGNLALRFEVNSDSLQPFGLKGNKEVKLPSSPIPREAEDVVIEIRPDSITHTIGGQSVRIGAAELGVPNLAQGQFRFRGPIGVKNFVFRPR